MLLLWQKIEDIDRENRNKKEEKSVTKRKNRLISKDFIGEI